VDKEEQAARVYNILLVELLLIMQVEVAAAYMVLQD
jgi:hypothetical protein